MITRDQRDEMREIFETLGEDGFYLNHYQLHEAIPDYTILEWKDFLLDPAISDWKESELRLLRQNKLAQLVQELGGTNIRSTGHAQQITALQKILETESGKTGPMIVYTYVPPNEEQEKAPNCEIAEDDYFARTMQEKYGGTL